MTWCRELFGQDKPIIGLLHLNPFPGDPRFDSGHDNMERCVEDARRDLRALQEGGVDGVLISNEFSFPYPEKAEHVIPACMARVIGELKSEIRLPFGIDLEADPIAAIDLAAAVDANFIRGTFTGTYVGVGGITKPDIAAILRRKHSLGLKKLRMLYFLNNESDAYLGEVDYADLASAIIFNCEPDALCLTGAHAGVEAKSLLISQVRERVKDSGVPVFAATGCNMGNIADKLAISDGAIVGTTLKYDGKFKNHIDPQRVKDFMRIVKNYREKDVINKLL